MSNPLLFHTLPPELNRLLFNYLDGSHVEYCCHPYSDGYIYKTMTTDFMGFPTKTYGKCIHFPRVYMDATLFNHYTESKINFVVIFSLEELVHFLQRKRDLGNTYDTKLSWYGDTLTILDRNIRIDIGPLMKDKLLSVFTLILNKTELWKWSQIRGSMPSVLGILLGHHIISSFNSSQ